MSISGWFPAFLHLPSFFLTCSGWWFGTFGLFLFSWECHHPNWRSHIFQRGSRGRYTIYQLIMINHYKPLIKHYFSQLFKVKNSPTPSPHCSPRGPEEPSSPRSGQDTSALETPRMASLPHVLHVWDSYFLYDIYIYIDLHTNVCTYIHMYIYIYIFIYVCINDY